MNAQILKKLELQLLLFPCLVLLLANVSFLFGLSCAAWQWWTAMAVTLFVPFFRENRRAAALSSGWFLLAMIGFWIVARFYFDSFGIDHVKYHFPATGLLIEGWNPITQATPEAIRANFGLEPDDMCWLQVLFMHKAVWLFNAVAYHFHHSPLCISVSAGYFVFLACSVVVYRALKEWRPIYRLMLIGAFFARCYFTQVVVDSVVSMAAFTMMLLMAEDIYAKRISIFQLVALSVWTMGSKSSGMAICGISWIIFAVLLLFRCRDCWRSVFVRLLKIAVLQAVLFLVVCASPYMTAWKDFGHPFYPMCTVDAKKHPVQSMAADFLVANNDWKKMGPIGFFANAYVSPKLTQMYYRWKLKQDEFRPVCATWVFTKDHSPLSFAERMRIWCVLLALLFCTRTRPLAIMAVCGLAFVPPYLYGLMRYFWWMQFLMYFVLFEYARRLEGLRRFHLNHFAQALGCIAVCYLAYRPTQAMLQSYINRAEMVDFCPQRAYCQIYPPYQLEKFDLSTIPNEGDRKLMLECHGADDSDSGSHLAINNVKLLARRWSNLSKTEIVPTRKSEARKKKFTKLGFYVD